MKINIIGGGPAGMYFAILMKKADAAHEITVCERNGPNDTFGWGVVFSGKTLANLRAADEESHAEITAKFCGLDNVDVVHRNDKISIHGNSFSGIERLQLLKILQRRCEQLGIELLFGTEIDDVDFHARIAICWWRPTGLTVPRASNMLMNFVLRSISGPIVTSGMEPANCSMADANLSGKRSGVFAALLISQQNNQQFIIECDQQTWKTAGFAAME